MDEKVVIQLILDKKDFDKSLNDLANKAEVVGKKAGNGFGRGFTGGLKSINTGLPTFLA